MEIFEKDCLVRIGTCIAPKGEIKNDDQKIIMSVKVELPNNEIIEETITAGTIKQIPLQVHQKASVDLHPSRGFDLGAGPGRELKIDVQWV
jgi:hypothetical protein